LLEKKKVLSLCSGAAAHAFVAGGCRKKSRSWCCIARACDRASGCWFLIADAGGEESQPCEW